MSKRKDKITNMPVNKDIVDRSIVSLTMNCRGCVRGIKKSVLDIYNISISVGHISTVLHRAMKEAKVHNMKQTLEGVSYGAHDELFQLNVPILAGVDIKSLYCYLLKQEYQRDGDTWGYHLLDLKAQEFNPNYIVCDQGSGLKRGQKTALPEIPCHGDIFHIIQAMKESLRFFKNRLNRVIGYRKSLEAKRPTNSKKRRQLAAKLSYARKNEDKYRRIEADLRILFGWMEQDILSVAGPSPMERQELYEFIVDEITILEQKHSHRIKEVRVALKNQKPALLGFTEVLNAKFKVLADKFGIHEYLVWDLCKLQKYKANAYYEKRQTLQIKLSYKCYDLEQAVINIMSEIQRTSSIAENYNSRIRPYFVVRKYVDNHFLELLRFYLNHTPFMRSSDPNRQGKTPAELLYNSPHPHWLEMLGFSPLQVAA